MANDRITFIKNNKGQLTKDGIILMKSQIISSIKIDNSLLKNEIEKISEFNFCDTYKEYACGELKICMLWNKSGVFEDSLLTNYNGNALKTCYGEKLPYLSNLIDETFKIEHLKFARIIMLGSNTVYVPHRDYLELTSDFLRFHIPIQTDSFCFNSEENTVYQMKVGEIWYIDATKIHSAASFSEKYRMHLVLDFEYKPNIEDVLKIPVSKNAMIPEKSIAQREPAPSNFDEVLYTFSKIIDVTNCIDILSILIKQYFTKNINVEYIFDMFLKISILSNNKDVINKAKNLKEYCTKNRNFIKEL